jgi:hypothetical protein
MITYRAINTTNGKFYIGSSKSWETFERRKRTHLKYGEIFYFQRALRANPDIFIWETYEDESEEPILEQALLDIWFGKEQCYNLSAKADKPPTPSGEKHPMFGRRGEKSPIYGRVWWVRIDGSEETHAYEQPGPHWKRGRKVVSKETKEKQSQRNRGKKLSSQHRARIGQSRLGLRWWVNEKGELKSQKENPGPEWKQGKKWRSP